MMDAFAPADNTNRRPTGHQSQIKRRPLAMLARGGILATLILSNQIVISAQNFGPTTAQDLTAPAPTPQFVPGEVIVKLKPVAGVATRGLAAKDLAPLGFQSAPRQTSGGELIYKFSQDTMFAMRSAEEARERVLAVTKHLNTRPDVEYAQANWILQHMDTTPNDPGYPLQWHYWNNGSGAGDSPGGINLPKAWDSGTGSSTVTVAVIDTGILASHADIVGSPNLAPGYDMISDIFTANDGNGRDGDPTDPGDATTANECYSGSPPSDNSWHGTHVAGTVGVGNSNNSAGVAGVNWQLKVVPVRVLGKCGGTISDINDAIRWAAGLPVPGVPANPDPAKVINLSLGGSGPCSASPSTQSAINDALGAGVTVVVAAGNDAKDAGNYMPASCDNVITVAASDHRGHLVSRYSNFGDTVEIMAPGGDVDRDDDADGNPDGVLSMIDGGYAFYNGTSMAAPHVSGVAALLLATAPSLSPAKVLAKLQASALPRSADQCPKPCGAGLLNADMASHPTAGFEYAAKLVCGVQKDPKNMHLARGFYATSINVHNPAEWGVVFTKKLALTVPPGNQRVGKVLPKLEDKLGPDEALSVACDDLVKRYFDGQLPAPYIEGFVVIRSPVSLDVTAVYSAASLSDDGVAAYHSSIHTEQIRERILNQQPRQKSSVVVKDISQPSVSAP